MSEQTIDERPDPAAVWEEMRQGNERFVAGAPRHPRQDVDRRNELAHSQTPRAALFGCSDSRLAAEIIFDQGLGDLFVVRNAGQVASDSAIMAVTSTPATPLIPSSPRRPPRMLRLGAPGFVTDIGSRVSHTRSWRLQECSMSTP